MAFVPYHWWMLTSFIVMIGLSTVLIYLSLVFIEIFQILSLIGVAIIILWFSWQITKLLKAIHDLCCGRVDPTDKVVLVTGCSSGFGYQLTVRLDALGFHVIGCCRNIEASNVQKLKAQCSNKLQVIRMDVSSDDEVDQVRMEFDQLLNGRKLWGVVNNAGIVTQHGVEWGSGMKLWNDVLDINTLGVIRVTRTFVPFLRQAPGSRLVIVTSIEDRIEPLTQPAYAASKYATRAFANSCRRELRNMGVHVSVIAPAFYLTEASNKESLHRMLEENWKDTSEEVRQAYGPDYYKMFVDFTDGTYAVIRKDMTPVVDAMADAVSKKCQPKYHQRVAGLPESLVLWFTDILPDELIDAMTTNVIVISMLNVVIFFKKLFQ